MVSIRTAGLTKNLGHLRAVNRHTLDLPEGVPSKSRPVCGRTGHSEPADVRRTLVDRKNKALQRVS